MTATPWTTAGERSCGPSSSSTSTPASRSARRASRAPCAGPSPRPPCATSWPTSRRSGTWTTRTRAPGGSRPTRATGSTWTRLMGPGPSLPGEAERIASELRSPDASAEQMLESASHLLSRLSRNVGFVLAPDIARASFRHLDLVPLAHPRILVVMVSPTGHRHQQGDRGRGAPHPGRAPGLRQLPERPLRRHDPGRDPQPPARAHAARRRPSTTRC